MLRGISSPHILQSLLGIGTEKEVNRLITLVEARWAITGRGRDLTRYRGAALARLDLLTSEMWSRLSSDNADLKPSDRVAMIRTILDIECQRNMLLGLSQTVITRMATLPNTGTGISGAIADQQALAATAGRFLELIAQRRREAGKAEVELIEAEAIDDAEAEYIYFEDAETEITAH
ncbi:hypothetical protein D3272_26065 [Lichenibacterium ramalinae]|uniref:Uncharacterized protein n=2 Tax=Lichenibacterium ramalinae TaxID=2316527 RepID=A0A4Q2R698_9HYPH|nr:hypothetical protein D3272_26065 [Lichenibacterium ramalinae]